MKSQNPKKEFEKFYNTHIDKVYRFVYFRVGTSQDLAQDLVSEIFMKALEHFDSYNEELSKSAWIMTIAKNHLANHWRDQRPTNHLPEDEDELSDSFWLKSAIDSFKNEENKRELEALLTRLNDDDREIVTFHYLLGYSYAEIARMKQMTETAVKVASHRAIKKLSTKI